MSINALKVKLTYQLQKLVRPIIEKSQPYRAQLSQRWKALAVREQRFVQALALILGVAFLGLGIWKPIQVSYEQAQGQLKAQQNYLQWMESQASTIQSIRAVQTHQTAFIEAQALPTFINEQASIYELEITRIQPQGDGQVVVLNEADFNQVLAFLEGLSRAGVQIQQVDIAETNQAGIVRVRRLQVKAVGA